MNINHNLETVKPQFDDEHSNYCDVNSESDLDIYGNAAWKNYFRYISGGPTGSIVLKSCKCIKIFVYFL